MNKVPGIFKNPAFLMVCVLVGVTPLMRGSVHRWAETLIQMMVMMGVILLLEQMLSKKDPSKQEVPKNTHTGIPFGQMFRYVVIPCTLLGIWGTLFSRHMGMAVEGLVMLMAYLAFFYLVFESVRTRQEQRALVWVMVGTAFFLCIIGLCKRFGIMVFPWWDYAAEFPKNYEALSLSGVYVNRNHMAGFLEMAIPVLLGLFLTRSRATVIHISMILLALFLILCQALTLSRGGWAATTGAMIFMMGVLLSRRGFAYKRLLISIAVAVVAVTVILLVSTPVVERIITITQHDIEDNIAGRLLYWASTWNMIKDNIFAGTGPGTYAVTSIPYLVPGLGVLPVFAHNDYLHITAETGIFFIPLMFWLLGLFFSTGFKKLKSRSRQTSGIALGCMASVVAILVHSYSDFNLHIPANIILFTAITALVLKPE